MQQFSSNFFGKDPFKWWIGQVTDPKKANWTTVLHTYETESGEEVYSASMVEFVLLDITLQTPTFQTRIFP